MMFSFLSGNHAEAAITVEDLAAKVDELSTKVDGLTNAAAETVNNNQSIDFSNPNFDRFLDNLQYLGSGMISIFLVIGSIVAIVYILNAITSRKKKKDDAPKQ